MGVSQASIILAWEGITYHTYLNLLDSWVAQEICLLYFTPPHSPSHTRFSPFDSHVAVDRTFFDPAAASFEAH